MTGSLIGLNSFLFMVTTWHKPLLDHCVDILEAKNTYEIATEKDPTR